jgi:hypothetical protein
LKTVSLLTKYPGGAFVYECFFELLRLDRSKAIGTVALINKDSLSLSLTGIESECILGKSYNSSGDLGELSLTEAEKGTLEVGDTSSSGFRLCSTEVTGTS